MNRLTDLTATELERQRTTLNLIASENYASPATLAFLGTIWNAKYAEGLPGKRYYAGNTNADELERYVQELALRVFRAGDDYGVNVQVLSGSPANALVYLTCLEPGDTVLSLDLSSGGHLSHLHETSSWLKFYRHETYRLKAVDGAFHLDADEFAETLARVKPKLVIIGFSAYPAAYDFAPLIDLAHRHDALVLADIAHIAGLVAAGRHSSPFAAADQGADFVTTTTHKTLRGPRGALVFARREWMDRLNQTVFPGTSGGPHLQQVAATGQALLEALGEANYPGEGSYADYINRVLITAKALERGLAENGLTPTTSTSTHLILIRLPEALDSLNAQTKLEAQGIVTNRNAIPRDPKTAWRPSGLRFGTAALTSRGLSEDQAYSLGKLIAGTLANEISEEEVRRSVRDLIARLTWPY